MPVYFFNKNPNILFPSASSYSKDDINQMFSGLTSDGVTQSAMTYAIEDFISETLINSIISDYTTNFISETSINNKFNRATEDFWTSDEIDSTLSGDTSYYYNAEELDVFASGKTSKYSKAQDVYNNAYSDAEVSQLYWHPEPYYKRTLTTDNTNYTLGGDKYDTIPIFVSGNTYWEVEQLGGFSASWYLLNVTTGNTDIIITVSAEEYNDSGSERFVDLEFSAVQINQTPFTIRLTQEEKSGPIG